MALATVRYLNRQARAAAPGARARSIGHAGQVRPHARAAGAGGGGPAA